MKTEQMQKDISIYIHIPFCERKCNYCAFTSFCATKEQIDDYIEDLCKELVARKTDRPVKTVYIGGGTPSILNETQIEKIVKTLFENFNIYEDAEFSVEANPNSITENLLKKWKSLRVNRISIGVQSLSDKSLQKIGRLHNKNTALEKIVLTRKYFDNVSADLIVGLENENGKDLRLYAKQLLALGVKHISCYLLEVYENTTLMQMIKNGQYKPLDDEQTVSTFNKLSNYLIDAGMERYEISNFAFAGYESQHNLNYWQRGDYLGFGLSAHSFVDGKRLQNSSNFADFKAGKVQIENLSIQDEIEEKIMLGLRCKLGVDLKSVCDLGYDVTKNPYFEDYSKQGIVTLSGGKMFLNPLFYHVSNTIISNLMP